MPRSRRAPSGIPKIPEGALLDPSKLKDHLKLSGENERVHLLKIIPTFSRM